MTPRKRPPRRLVIDYERLLNADPGLANADAMWCASGYARSGARLWRRRDGTYTARVVWRNRTVIASTIVYTIRGIPL